MRAEKSLFGRTQTQNSSKEKVNSPDVRYELASIFSLIMAFAMQPVHVVFVRRNMIQLQGWQERRRNWSSLTVFQKFESSVAYILMAVIGAIILVSLFQLFAILFTAIVSEGFDALSEKSFQTVFGSVMTLLIALEFNHTLLTIVKHQETFVQARIVLLIAILALSRKFIVLDLHDISGVHLLGLASVNLTLGLTYWLIREK